MTTIRYQIRFICPFSNKHTTTIRFHFHIRNFFLLDLTSNPFQVFNGNLSEALEKLGPDNLKTNLKAFFDDVILLLVF